VVENVALIVGTIESPSQKACHWEKVLKKQQEPTGLS
jgi:hypothetical protein